MKKGKIHKWWQALRERMKTLKERMKALRAKQTAGYGEVEANSKRITMESVTSNFLEVWGFGNKNIFVTIGHLFWRPGYMMRDYLEGRRGRLMQPVMMLVVLTLGLMLLGKILPVEIMPRESATLHFSEARAQLDSTNPNDAETLQLLNAVEQFSMYMENIRQWEEDHPDFGLFSCAAQVQLDAEEQTLPEVFNTFTKLEPLKSVIFANSLWGRHHEILCGRDGFWKNSLHGLNRHNVDMYRVAFTSSEEISSYIKSMSLYCVERDGKYINFAPTRLEDYFSSDSVEGEYFSDGGYQTIRFAPRIEDLDYLRSFKFEDLTYRGTVEFRSVCTQPVRDIMSVSAFHTGLMERLPDLTKRLDEDRSLYHKGYNAAELRELLNRRPFPTFLDRGAVSSLITDVLDIAADGLRERGLNEEGYLAPLYERAKTLTSPARRLAEGLENGVPLDRFIREYAAL